MNKTTNTTDNSNTSAKSTRETLIDARKSSLREQKNNKAYQFSYLGFVKIFPQGNFV